MMRGGAGARLPLHQLGIKGRSGWISPALDLFALPWPLLLPPATASLVLFSLLSVLSHTKIVVKSFLPVTKTKKTKKQTIVLFSFFCGFSPQKVFVTESVRRDLVC